MTSSKTYCRKELRKRLGNKSERTIRRMQKPEHRHYLPPPDKGDRWSEEYLHQIERKWHDTDERRAVLRGKHAVPAGSFPMTTKVSAVTRYIDGYAGRVLAAWQKQEADAHD